MGCRMMALRCALVLLLMCPGMAGAQARFTFGARASTMPIHDGDATIGAVRRQAITLSGGLMKGPTRNSELEAFYTLSLGKGTHSSPTFQMAGVLFSGHRGIESIVSGVATFGLGVIDVRARLIPCEFPHCIAEGGAAFRSVTLPTLIGGLGLDLRLHQAMRLRADTRAHLPIGGGDSAADSGKLRVELGAGLRLII